MLTRLSFALHPSPAFTCQLPRIDVSFVPRAESSGRTAHDEYSYNSGSNDERRKATIEHIYRDTDGVAKNSSSSSVPWSMGWQMNERNTVWNDDLKLRLLKRSIAEKARLQTEEMDARLNEVISLLPGLVSRLPYIKADTAAQLCADPRALAERLLQVKSIFPGADAAQIFLEHPMYMLRQDISIIKAAADRLRDLIPDVDVDKLVEEHPQLLDVKGFEQALSHARETIPSLDVGHMMRYNPSMIFGFQRGAQLIPYDEVPTSP